MEEEPRDEKDEPHLDVAHEDIGNDLADEHLEGMGRHGEQVFHGPAFVLTGDRKGRNQGHGHGEDDPQEPRHDVVFREGLGVIKRVDPQFYWSVPGGEKCEGAFEIVLQRRVQKDGGRAEGIAGRPWIGRIRLYEKDRPVTPEEIVGKILRDLDDELHLAPGQRVVRLRFCSDLLHEVEVARILDRGKERANLSAVVRQEHGRGQMLGVGVDGIPEEDELNEGNAYHHVEGEAVPAHLDELLDDHGPAPGK